MKYDKSNKLHSLFVQLSRGAKPSQLPDWPIIMLELFSIEISLGGIQDRFTNKNYFLQIMLEKD